MLDIQAVVPDPSPWSCIARGQESLHCHIYLWDGYFALRFCYESQPGLSGVSALSCHHLLTAICQWLNNEFHA